jgi:hypothetical protein
MKAKEKGGFRKIRPAGFRKNLGKIRRTASQIGTSIQTDSEPDFS